MATRRTLHVDNLTRNNTLVESGRVADTFLTRLRGLTGVRKLLPGDGLLIKPCTSIHTHFMLIPIDVLYIDSDERIVDMDVNMQTWRMGQRRPEARCVIEVPSGTLTQAGCEIGDKLRIAYE